MKISTLSISKLRVQEDFGYMELVKNETDQLPLLDSATGYTVGLKNDTDAFTAAFLEFDTALKAAKSVPSAAEVSELDHQRDGACVKLHAYAKAVSDHPDKDMAKTGAEAIAIFKKYGGVRLVDQPQNQESGSLRNLLQDLQAMGASRLTQTGIKAFVDDLEQKQTAYLAAVKQRAKEEQVRLVGIIKQKRLACDAAYLKLVETVNALVIVNGEAPYRGFVDSVLSHIAHQKATLANRETNAEKKPKDPKDPKQPKDPKDPKQPKDPKEPKPQPDPKPTPDPKPQPDPKPKPKPGDDDGDDVYIPKD